MNGKHFVGRRVSSFEAYDTTEPITGVVLLLDDETEVMAGTDDGYIMEISCPYGTQTMANRLLADMKGKTYRGYHADGAELAIEAELGDGVTVNGLYAMLAYRSVTFGAGHLSEIAAPSENEIEHEYPYISQEQRSFNHKIAQTRSLITKTSEQIRLEVKNEVNQLESAIQISLDNIEAKVEDNARGLSQTVRLAADGLTITNASGSRLTIDGGQIKAASIETSAFKANSITADKLNITGAITFGDLDANTQGAINGTASIANNAYNYAGSAYNYAGNAYTLANNAYNLAASNTPPSYIKSTYIDSVSIQSPTIMGGTFIGNTFNVISEYGGGSFNLYGKYGNQSVHALTIAYSAGLAPMTSFYSPSGGYASWDFDVTYMSGSISMGSGDISFSVGGYITSIREMYERLEALGG